VCPFVNKGEHRCAAHWTLENVADAFRHCADEYRECPIHRELMQESFANEPGAQGQESLLAAS